MISPHKAEGAFSIYLMNRDFKPGMVAWAVEVLCAGGGGEATTLLAGADHEDDITVISLFRKAAAVHGVVVPEEGADFGVIELWWCRRVVAGQVGPLDGLTQLWKNWMASDYDPRFYRWMWLSESVELLEEGIWGGFAPFDKMTLETMGETIVNEAKKVVEDADSGAAVMPPLQG